MKCLKKYKWAIIAVALLISVIPLSVYSDDSDDSFRIAGWFDESALNAVKNVKLNGVELTEYNPCMYDSISDPPEVYAQPSSSVNIEITLEEGYELKPADDGSVVFVSGVQSGTKGITSGTDKTTITIPDSGWLAKDEELYLSFETKRSAGDDGLTRINNVELDVTPLDCATVINDRTDPSPQVTVPKGKGYEIEEDSADWVKKDGGIYIDGVYPFVAKGVNGGVFMVDIVDKGKYVFNESLSKDDITIKNGELLDLELLTAGGPGDESTAHVLCLTVRMELNHSTVNPKVTEKAPTCTEDGYTHKVARCTKCNEDIIKEVAIPATGHKWDAGKVTKAATEKAEGVKTYTCTVCKATKTEIIPKLKPSAPKVIGTLTAKSKSITISWNKIQDVAGYDIFFARCNHDSKEIVTKKVKTIKDNKTFEWTKSGLKKGTAYKAYVRAYVYKNGKKTYVKNSPLMHAYTGNGTKNYTNAKSVSVNKTKVTLKKGKTFKIKAKVKKISKKKKLMPKSHAPALRYMTTNKKVATVSKSGKITAKGKGTCTVYVFAHNGVSKQIKVTVK